MGMTGWEAVDSCKVSPRTPNTLNKRGDNHRQGASVQAGWRLIPPDAANDVGYRPLNGTVALRLRLKTRNAVRQWAAFLLVVE